MVRSIVVIAPSGLGVVDLGYATVFGALGADPGNAAAFVLLRRAKEAVWVAIGYATLTALRGKATRPAEAVAGAVATPTPEPVRVGSVAEPA
jgi:uncharacterized membrane protein YbhN (UPF0104 family)